MAPSGAAVTAAADSALGNSRLRAAKAVATPPPTIAPTAKQATRTMAELGMMPTSQKTS